MYALFQTIDLALSIFTWILIGSAIFSWLYAFNVINVNNQAINMIGRSLYQLTEPLYRPIRKILPDFGMLDLSPMVVLLIVIILRESVIPRLRFQFY